MQKIQGGGGGGSCFEYKSKSVDLLSHVYHILYFVFGLSVTDGEKLCIEATEAKGPDFSKPHAPLRTL